MPGSEGPQESRVWGWLNAMTALSLCTSGSGGGRGLLRKLCGSFWVLPGCGGSRSWGPGLPLQLHRRFLGGHGPGLWAAGKGAGSAAPAVSRKLSTYAKLWEQAVKEPQVFWGRLAQHTLVWDTPYHTVEDCDFNQGKISWFLGGQLNVSVNCLDQHVQKSPDRIALIWEKDEPGTEVKITYSYRC